MHRRTQILFLALSLLGTGLSAAPAWACTLCHSQIGEEVRSVIFGPDFWSNVMALLVPVPLLLAATCAIRNHLP